MFRPFTGKITFVSLTFYLYLCNPEKFCNHKDKHRTINDWRFAPAHGRLLNPREKVARSFTRSLHSAEDYSSIYRRNCRRSKNVWLFQPFYASCKSNSALSRAVNKKCSFHRFPYPDCKNVARRPDNGRLYWRSWPAPYIHAWHRSTLPAPTVLATNKSASLQQQTSRHQRYNSSPVLDFEGGHHNFCRLGFHSLHFFALMLLMKQAIPMAHHLQLRIVRIRIGNIYI